MPRPELVRRVEASVIPSADRWKEAAGERARRPRTCEEGYRAGYAEGTRDGFSSGYANGYAAGTAPPGPRSSRRRPNRADGGGPPSKADLKWALRHVHPDVVDSADADRAHRVAAWLNAMSTRRTDL